MPARSAKSNTALDLDDLTTAQTYFDESHALRQSIGDDGRYLQRSMANLALRTGDYAAAIQHFQHSLRTSWQAQELSNVLDCVKGIAIAASFAQLGSAAAQLLGAADALSAQFNITPNATQTQQRAEAWLRLHDGLSATEFASAYAEGQTQSLAQTVAQALARTLTKDGQIRAQAHGADFIRP
jgi:hypothetical protein